MIRVILGPFTRSIVYRIWAGSILGSTLYIVFSSRGPVSGVPIGSLDNILFAPRSAPSIFRRDGRDRTGCTRPIHVSPAVHRAFLSTICQFASASEPRSCDWGSTLRVLHASLCPCDRDATAAPTASRAARGEGPTNAGLPVGGRKSRGETRSRAGEIAKL